MKKSFPGHYRPTEAEFSELWKNCLFVLDANVLLNLYRYSPETTEELMGILSEISDRLWVPHQAALEYQENRLDVIQQQAGAYGEIVKLLDQTQGNLQTKLRSSAGQRRHPFIKADDLLERIGNIFTEVKKELKELEQAHPDLFDEDHIREALTELLETKVGCAYSSERMRGICREGERRYQEKIPPGYLDAHKESTSQYGDLVLWFQVIDKAKETKKPVILVTDDVKEDWWLQFKGETIAPRPELGNEMASQAGVSFWMYPAHRFMEEARKYLKREVKQEAIDEVEEVRRRSEEYPMSKIYTTVSHPEGYHGLPWYEIRGNEIYTTVSHPQGYQGLPWFEIRGNEIYTTISHPEGYHGLPWFEIRGNEIYTTVHHPRGWQGLPWFEIRD